MGLIAKNVNNRLMPIYCLKPLLNGTFSKKLLTSICWQRPAKLRSGHRSVFDHLLNDATRRMREIITATGVNH